ncbi:MAG: hypothetical protein HQL74_12560 [Magnetococcales bacterium]|nr:hypothetical protein [Magnetococcales bacterium]
MARPQQNIEFVRGDTLPIPIEFYDFKDNPLDITGNVLWITLKKNVSDRDADAVFQKRIVCPENTDSMNGTGLVVLTSAETKLLNPGVYLYDIQHVIPGDPPVVSTPMSGTIKIHPDITQNDG